MLFKNHEYVGDVFGSTTFGVTATGQLSPTEETLFKILSQMANNFELYKWVSLTFEYRSTCVDSTNAAFANLGTIMMNVNYDPTEPVPSSKTELLNTQNSKSCRVTNNMKFTINVDKQMRYVRQGGFPAVQNLVTTGQRDLRDESNGRYSLAAADNVNATTVLGQLHVYYAVELFKPKMYDALGGGNKVSQFYAPKLIGLAAGDDPLMPLIDLTTRACISDELAVQFARPTSGSTTVTWNGMQGEIYRIELLYMGVAGAAVVETQIAYSATDLRVVSEWPGFGQFGGAAIDSIPPFNAAPNTDPPTAATNWDNAVTVSATTWYFGAAAGFTYGTQHYYKSICLKLRKTGNVLITSSATGVADANFRGLGFRMTLVDRPSMFRSDLFNPVANIPWTTP